ncbi:MAG: cell division protein FtsL [Bacillota bacterium]|uniref:cell division protein FtsL n=1 Tax=Desulfurispora thermophila TaxID=265470 RepID=UPI0003684246|nr:cell division protein FtsL [Desulfurispora thermophila]
MIVAQERYQQYNLPVEEQKRRPVRRPVRQKHPERAVLLCLMVALLGTGMGIVYYYAQLVSTAYQIYCLKQELQALQQETESLAAGIADLSSLRRVEQVAVHKLGMVRPDGQTLVLHQSVSNQPSEPPARPPAGQRAQAALAPGQPVWLQVFARLMGQGG